MTAGPTLGGARLRRWRQVAPERWKSRLPTVLAWVALIVVSTLVENDGGCTLERPCTSDWGSAVDGALVVAAPILLLWAPGLGVVVSYAALLAYVGIELQLRSLPHGLVLVLGALVLLVVLWQDAQLRVRRRAEDVAAAAEHQGRWDGPVDLPPGSVGRGRWVGGAVFLIGLALCGYAFHRDADDSAAERSAAVAEATVLAHDEDDYSITLRVDDTRHTVGVLDTGDYPVGSTQPVYLVGDEVRLLAAPHDDSGWLLLGLGVLLLGGTLAGLSARDRRSVLRVLRTPQPQMMARLGLGDDLVVLDPQGGPPLVALAVVDPVVDAVVDVLPEQLAGADLPEPDLDDLVLLHGRPVPGRACAVRLADGTALVPYALNGRADPDWRPRTEGPDDELTELGWQEPAASTEPASATWPGVPLWRPLLGVAVVIGSCVGVFVACRTGDSVIGTLLKTLFFGGGWAVLGLDLLAGSVRLEERHLVIGRPTSVLRVPWSRITAVLVNEGNLGVRCGDGRLTPLPWPTSSFGPLRPRSTKRAVALAAVLRSRISATGVSDEQVEDEGRLAGAVVALAVVAAALLGLWSRSHG